MATCAGGMHVALQAVGTAGAATAERGGAAGRSFRMVQLAEGQTAPTQVRLLACREVLATCLHTAGCPLHAAGCQC